MKLGIVGSRKLEGSVNAYKIIQAYIESFQPEKIISGGAIGIDSMAVEVAVGLGYVLGDEVNDDILIHYPKPKGPGTGAYIRALFERNGWIVRDSDSILAVTLPGGSNGTRDTIKKAMDAGRTVYVQETT